MLLKRLGPEATANTSTNRYQFFQKIAALPSGGYVVVWMSDHSGGDYDIVAQRFSADGAKVGGEILVNIPGSIYSSQSLPMVSALASGGFATAWIDSYNVIKARIVGADGVPVGQEIPVTATASFYHSQPAIAALPDGGFVVGWTDERKLYSADGGDLRGQMFDSSGAPAGPEFTINTLGQGGQTEIRAAALTGGGFVFVWRHQTGDPADPGNIKAQMFDSAGNRIGTEFLVPTAQGFSEWGADIAALPNGGFVISWQGPDPVLNKYEAQAQMFSATGARIGPVVTASNPENGVSSVEVTSLAGGGFVVGWANTIHPSGHTASRRGQMFDAEGNRLGSQFQINSDRVESGGYLDMATLSSGRVVAVWNADRPNAGYDVRMQVFRAPLMGTPLADSIEGTAFDDGIAGLGSDDILDGKEGDDSLEGGAGADQLTGGAGNDELDGGAGDDSMTGGIGNDIYVVDSAADWVAENASEGTDEVRTGLAAYVLPANVEKLTATSGVAHDFRGNAGDNVVTGGAGDDILRLQDGGEDFAIGGAGNDGILFGASLSAGDAVDGGEGTRDQLGLQGNYGTFGAGAAAFTLGAGHLVNVEMLVLLSGADSRFGDTAGNFYGYNLATVDASVAVGRQLVVSFNTLRVGENVTFDGSAETNGSFMTYGGLGTDVLTGGQQSDSFYFGADSRFAPGDRVDGQGGSLDQLGLQGDYSGARAVTFAADSMTGIEMIVLLSAGDARFGGGSGDGFSYDIVMNDGNVAAGAKMYISANALRSDGTLDERLDFDGSAEKDGVFTIYAGSGSDTLIGGERADEIWGGGGADRITGGLGADFLRGGEGDDVFDYNSVAESGAASRDLILDFTSGSDRIDLSGIDANSLTDGDQAFSFIGSGAFTGSGAASAGQLRAYQGSGSSGAWIVEGDVNGDGVADFRIGVVVGASGPIVSSDFIL
jgi:Ca2+-binding RTX toxin-like protein